MIDFLLAAHTSRKSSQTTLASIPSLSSRMSVVGKSNASLISCTRARLRCLKPNWPHSSRQPRVSKSAGWPVQIRACHQESWPVIPGIAQGTTVPCLLAKPVSTMGKGQSITVPVRPGIRLRQPPVTNRTPKCHTCPLLISLAPCHWPLMTQKLAGQLRTDAVLPVQPWVPVPVLDLLDRDHEENKPDQDGEVEIPSATQV